MSEITNAMLCRVVCHVWAAQKIDRKVEQSVDDTFSAERAGTFTKALLHRTSFKGITTAVNAIRAAYRRYTLPWEDGGYRLLPSDAYFPFRDAMSSLKACFALEVDEFVCRYDDLIEERKATLGELFNEAEYPDPEKIRDRFRIDVSFAPVPDSSDFRCNLKSDTDELKESIDKVTSASLEAAAGELVNRVTKCLGQLTDGIKRVEDGGRIRQDLLDNIEELAALLPALNFSGDENVTKAAESMGTLVASTDIEDIRDHETAREQAKVEVNEILAQLGVNCVVEE